MLGVAGLACMRIKLPARASAGLFDPFSFAVVSDIHLCTDSPDSFILLKESQLFLQDVVKQLNEERLDFVMFTGDQVEHLGGNQANWQLFLDIAQGLNAPWSYVLGDRDISNELPVDKMRQFGPDWRSRGIATDFPYWSMNPLPGVHIVGLDTSRANSATGDLSPRQLSWLKEDLAKNKHDFTIVFSHHPLLAPPPYDGGPPWDEYILPQGPAVREVLGGFPHVRLAVSGHVYASKVEQEKDIWYVSCPGLTVYPCAFRIFHVSPDQIEMETRQIIYPALIKKAKRLLIDSGLSYKYNSANQTAFAELVAGERIDNDALLPLVAGVEAKALPRKKPRRSKSNQGSKPRTGTKDGSEPKPAQGATHAKQPD